MSKVNNKKEPLESPLAINFAEEVLSEINSIESQVDALQVTNSQVDYSKVDNEQELTESPQYISFDQLKTQIDNKIPINEILEIKKYIPIIEKGILVSNIVSACTDIDDNSMTRINYNNLEIVSKLRIIESFTNYAFDPDTIIAELDYILEHELDQKIYNEITWDIIWSVEECVSKELEQIMKIENGIENVINKHLYLVQDKLEMLISKIPNFEEKKVDQWIKSLGKTLKGFDPSKMESINKMMSFVKGEDK